MVTQAKTSPEILHFQAKRKIVGFTGNDQSHLKSEIWVSIFIYRYISNFAKVKKFSSSHITFT